MNSKTKENTLRCKVIGLGAWGPGFNQWQELSARLLQDTISDDEWQSVAPKPAVIPANERRRSPLPVKIAVETSSQALEMSGLSSADVACVFGSGLGDTEITDYMCRVLNTELKQLSPTKFHNSVHNAAAGYWTISSACMKSANSIAAYHETAGMALLEAVSQCVLHNEAVMITLFDTKAHSAYQQIFSCRDSFSASLLICPESYSHSNASLASLTLDVGAAETLTSIQNKRLDSLRDENPAAKILSLLEPIANSSDAEIVLGLSEANVLRAKVSVSA